MKIKKIETDYSNNKILQISNQINIQNSFFFKEEFNIINIYPNIEKQSFIGFGAAFNESTAYNFSKLPNDKKYLIPIIKSALSIHPNLNLIVTPWSPPSFMKDNNNMNHVYFLLKKCQNSKILILYQLLSKTI